MEAVSHNNARAGTYVHAARGRTRRGTVKGRTGPLTEVARGSIQRETGAPDRE